MKHIAAVMGVHPNTVRIWIDKEGFPANKLPCGEWVTTDTLIEQWMLSRANVQRDKRLNKNEPESINQAM